ncbi:gamma-aminobutyric acid receptor alpha-like [Panulirus ornatus]|uniref:gamma-aminobutyric acid receptor alpha-like n=1 Tax=Panulirus ornatus TaxID=150431 RepID=UPI003A84D716
MLKRHSEAFLLSVIGPCLVLCFLGHLTFVAYPLHKFDERTSTSVTLLIVVAALFSQAVSTLPETASPKAIDVWFFYFILRFFLFFVFHWLVDLQYRLVTDAERPHAIAARYDTLKGDNSDRSLEVRGSRKCPGAYEVA